MQGTVNSLELFNIYTHSITTLFDLNSNNNTYSTTFADDNILMVANKYPSIVQNNLETLANKINFFYLQWNLKINPDKCETILFHKPLRFLGQNVRSEIRNFRIQIHHLAGSSTIAHKKSVRYLGVQLDYLFKLTPHITSQLQKAKNALRANSRLFFCKSLSVRTKIICYLLLIRPLITYASPILWNTSASTMEKLRKFERHCLRICLHVFRNPITKKLVSNRTIYNLANIPRIDNFLIKINRNYFANLPNVNNPIMTKFNSEGNRNFEPECLSEYLPPHAFIFLDKSGIIQDHLNTPILYHFPRNQANKAIPLNSINHNNGNTVYSRSIPTADPNDFHRLKNKYWWLAEDAIFIDEIRRRKRSLLLPHN